MSIKLRGMTWSHPRGYDPMVAVSALWKDSTGVEIAWDKRSLQDFESFPVEDLAARYDFIVIDHPHVGQITHEKCLLPLDVAGRGIERAALRAGSIGQSYDSYTWQGHQWAFPIDAASQVQAWRPDRLAGPVRRWDEVFDLARQGRVAIPLRPPHSLMCFYTLAAHIGAPCHLDGSSLIAPKTGVAVLERLKQFAAMAGRSNFEKDPIAVLDDMGLPDSAIDCVPLIYGYVPYARDGFRERRVAFADIPADDGLPPRGSALGGTGIAVSAKTKYPQEAVDFAYFIASGAVQVGTFAHSGGQPGHDQAWVDEAINLQTHCFYHETRATLEAAWVRPRYNGYMPFQHGASERINEALLGRMSAAACIDEINELFWKSQAV